MSRGLEILRRLLIALGAIGCGFGFLLALALAINDPDDRRDCILGMAASVAGFFGWRAAVNWVLLYEPAKEAE
jgi:hypothetical protein